MAKKLSKKCCFSVKRSYLRQIIFEIEDIGLFRISKDSRNNTHIMIRSYSVPDCEIFLRTTVFHFFQNEFSQ
jgi:hypothetical protein